MSKHSFTTWPMVSTLNDYWSRVQILRQALAQGAAGPLLALDATAASDPRHLVPAAQAWLVHWVDQREKELKKHWLEVYRRHWPELKYLLAALTDEVLIFETDWPGADAWLQVLLEQHWFKTRHAGQSFFARADSVLTSAEPSAVTQELAALYLMALQWGFEGRHRGQSGAPELTALMARLQTRVNLPNAPAHAAPVPLPAFAQAYDHTVVRPVAQPRPLVQIWSRWALKLALALLVFWLGAWVWLTWPLWSASA